MVVRSSEPEGKQQRVALQPWDREGSGVWRPPTGDGLPEGLGELVQMSARACPEQLAACALLRRTDTKFVVSEEELLNVLGILAGRYDVVFSGEKSIARYRTEYLDTSDYAFYQQHVQGRRPRYKARVRHYLDRGVAFAEVKEKLPSGQTAKERRVIDYSARELDVEEVAFAREGSKAPGALHSTLVAEFQRIMLVHPVHTERLTIDLGLQVSDGTQRASFDGAVVVEVKQAQFRPRTPIMLALREVGARPASFSKYCGGLAVLKPPAFRRYALDNRAVLSSGRRLS